MSKEKKKKVAIIGTVPHKLKAPFNDNDFEIWAIAHACLGEPLPRVDRIFEIHKWDEVVKWGSPQAWKMFPDIPVYLIEARKDVPHSVAFPFSDLEEKFQIFEHRRECYFTNSISEMIALAIDEGFEEIHVYGVNMSHHTEYEFQKPSCEYFLGYAKAKGIKIYVPPESDLCKSFYIYGRDEEQQTDMIIKLNDRMSFLMGAHNQYKMQNEQARDAMNRTIGELECWKKFDQKEDKVKEQVENLNKVLMNQRYQFETTRDAINQHIGAMEDIKFILGLIKQ